MEKGSSSAIAIRAVVKRLLLKRHLNSLIKLFVAVMLLWVIYRQIVARDSIGELWTVFLSNVSVSNAPWLLMAVLLMPLNWAFETFKWQVLIHHFERLGFWPAYKAVLSGVSFSVFTPNRIGEYAGRIFFVSPQHNWKAVIATLVGSFSQLMVLLGMGLAGLGYFAFQYFELEPYVLKSTLFFGVILVGIMFFCFFNIDLVIPLVKRIPFVHYFKKLVRDVSLLRNYRSAELSQVLIFALLRYLVYTLQYYFLLRFFGIEVPPLAALAGIATIFLIQTSLPIMPLLGLFARVEIALFIWGYFCSNDISILASTFSLWIINLIVPALIGMMFIMNVNVLKSIGYEN